MAALIKKSVLLLVLLSALNGCAWNAGPAALPAGDVRLVQLILQRLELARHVAWFKYVNHLPIYDAQREHELLTSLVQQGTAIGLSSDEVRMFFTAQIRASRQVQADLIHKWKRGALLPPFAPVSLREDIRPKLNAISAQMLQELVQLQKMPPSPGLAARARHAIRKQGYSWQTARFASAPL